MVEVSPSQGAVITSPSEARAELKLVRERLPTFDRKEDLSIESFIDAIEKKGSRLPDRFKGDLILSNVKKPSLCYDNIIAYASKHDTDDWSAFKEYLLTEYGNSAAEEEAYKTLTDPLSYEGLDIMKGFRKYCNCADIVPNHGTRKRGLVNFFKQLPAELREQIHCQVVMAQDVNQTMLDAINRELTKHVEMVGSVTLGAKNTSKTVLKVEEEPCGVVNAVRSHPTTSSGCYSCGSPRHYRRDCPQNRGRGNQGARRGGYIRGGGRGGGRGSNYNGGRGSNRNMGRVIALLEDVMDEVGKNHGDQDFYLEV